MQRPASIIRFEQFYGIAIILGLAGTALSWGSDKAVAAREQLGTSASIAVIAVSIAVQLLLWFFIARKASPIAKWIFIVLLVLGVVGILVSVFAVVAGLASAFEFAISVAATGLDVAAALMLFRPDAEAWFNDGRGKQ